MPRCVVDNLAAGQIYEAPRTVRFRATRVLPLWIEVWSLGPSVWNAVFGWVEFRGFGIRNGLL